MRKSIALILLMMAGGEGYAQTNTFPPSGKVGIGTTSRDVQLQINGGAVRLKNPSPQHILMAFISI